MRFHLYKTCLNSFYFITSSTISIWNLIFLLVGRAQLLKSHSPRLMVLRLFQTQPASKEINPECHKPTRSGFSSSRTQEALQLPSSSITTSSRSAEPLSPTLPLSILPCLTLSYSYSPLSTGISTAFSHVSLSFHRLTDWLTDFLGLRGLPPLVSSVPPVVPL